MAFIVSVVFFENEDSNILGDEKCLRPLATGTTKLVVAGFFSETS